MKNQLLCMVAPLLLFVSCTGMMSPRYYYQGMNAKRSSTDPSSEEVIIPDDDPLNDLESNTDPSKDPFKTESEWNKINYQFDGAIIDSWFFHVDFDDNTVPTYQFKNDSGHGAWTLANEEKGEYTSTSPDGENKAQGYNITGMTVYRYNSKHPLYQGTATYNKAGGRMERFRFFRIKGKSVIVALDQHLIAVDTYSKFVFAYGKITKTSSVAGKLVPMAFEPLDISAAPAGQMAGSKLPFYMYDPIGFVKADGTVVLYEEYRSEMGNATTGQTKYFPQVHDVNREIAKPTSSTTPGRSPYFSTDGTVEIELTDPFLDTVANGLFQYRLNEYIKYEKKGGGTSSTYDAGAKLDSWSFDTTGKQLTFVQYTTDGNTVTVTDPVVWTYKDGQYTKEKETSDDGVRIYEKDGESMTVNVESNKLWRTQPTRQSLGESNYQDPGPHFLLRVRGATFKNGGLSYTFSEKGGKVTITGIGKRSRVNCDGDYWFTTVNKGELLDANTVVYDSGPADYTPLKLENSDYSIRSKIKVSNYQDVAYRIATGVTEEDPDLALFFSQLAGKTFKQRLKEQWYDVGELYGWKVKSYAFSGNGRTLTVTTEDGSDYVLKTTVETYTYKDGSLFGGKGTYTSGGQSLAVSLSGNDLKSGNTLLGSVSYSDPGPHFLVRVGGWTFEEGETRYVFSPDGRTLEFTFKGLAYMVVPTLKSETREWQGTVNDTVETKYGGIWTRLQDSQTGKTAGDTLAKPGTNKWIKVKQTAQGWSGASWEYAAPRTVKN
ncbi:MAG: hypothetical protein IJ191_05205 [Treponema sp.]|nr:hypothetical protein [Treponema sp.]